MQRLSTQSRSKLPIYTWGLACGLLMLTSQAWAQNTGSLYWVDAKSKLIDPSLPLQLELSGESFAGQVLQLEQRRLVIYEQQLPEGSFRLLMEPLLDNSSPLVVKLKSPNQPDAILDIPLTGNQKRTLTSKRPDLLALAPANTASGLGAQLPRQKLDDDIEFDMDFLKGKAFRDLSPLEAKRLGGVRPGNVDADIYRNGRMVSKSTVKFAALPNSENVQPCISPELFQQFDVKPAYISPEGIKLMNMSSGASSNLNCLFIDQWVAGATTEFDPSDLRLDVTIAQAFLSKTSRQSVPAEMLTRGENAGFINYNLNNYNALGISSNFLGLQSGANIGGWQLRYSSYVTQTVSNNFKQSQFVSGDTYIKRPLLSMKASLVLGNTSSNSPIIGSTPIRGVRLSSEEGMMPDEERSYRPIITGVARTNARVRVSQNNVVLFEQTVPPGPFQFDDINPFSAVGNLQVVINEADGSQQTFVVPYSQAAGKLNPGSVRYSVATGNYRNFTSTQNTTVLQAYVRYGLNEFWSPGVEVLMSSNYRNLGLQASFNSSLGSLSFNTLFSNLSNDNNSYSGFAHNLNYNAPAMGDLSAAAGLGMQSVKYTTPSAGLNLGTNALFTNDSFKYNAFVGLNLRVRSYGGVSLSVNQQRNWKNEGSQQVRLGMGTNVGKVNLGISLDQTSFTNNSPSVSGFSVSASVPLNFGVSSSGGLRAGYIQRGDADPSQTLSYYGGIRESQLNYSLSQTSTGERTNSSASANWSHNYGSLGASYSSASSGDEQYGLSASGGLVLHSGGVLLAPYLGETFGIVEVPKGEGAGVVGSTTRINSQRFGVVSNLSPYYMNEVQISLEGASTELEVETPSQRVAPVEGSIVRLKFNANTGRPLLIVLQPSSGKRVPIGASVSDEQGLELGTVGQGSRALVRVKKPKDRLKVVWGDKPNETCFFEYDIDEKTKPPQPALPI